MVLLDKERNGNYCIDNYLEIKYQPNPTNQKRVILVIIRRLSQESTIQKISDAVSTAQIKVLQFPIMSIKQYTRQNSEQKLETSSAPYIYKSLCALTLKTNKVRWQLHINSERALKLVKTELLQ